RDWIAGQQSPSGRQNIGHPPQSTCEIDDITAASAFTVTIPPAVWVQDQRSTVLFMMQRAFSAPVVPVLVKGDSERLNKGSQRNAGTNGSEIDKRQDLRHGAPLRRGKRRQQRSARRT